MCHHCGNDCCNNTCGSGDISLTDDNINTGNYLNLDNSTLTCGTSFTITGCTEKCYFCENDCIECIQYDNQTLHVCSTHKDALKGRLGQVQTYFPYYAPEPTIIPIWPPTQPWTEDPIDRF